MATIATDGYKKKFKDYIGYLRNFSKCPPVIIPFKTKHLCNLTIVEDIITDCRSHNYLIKEQNPHRKQMCQK